MTTTFRMVGLLLIGTFLLNNMYAQLPDGFYDELVYSNMDQHTGIVFDEMGRGFTWRRTGEVFMLDTNGVLLSEPVIDISEEVASWWDMGMLGFALDPQFLENGKIYLYYVVDRHHLLYYGTPEYDPTQTIKDEATIGRITRYTLDPAEGFQKVVAGSRQVLLGRTASSGFPLLFKTHGTGSLAFGTDGTLLASCGETGHPDWPDTGGSAETYHSQALTDGIIREPENVGAYRSQLLNSLSGKIVRIDPVSGAGLSSNPFYDESDPFSAQSRVWSLGLRNPFRFIVQPNSGSHFPDDARPGALLIGDVGSNFWEELNISTEGGQNFGWPVFEGFEEQVNYVSRKIPNRDAKNPLFAAGLCDDEFFLFDDLIVPPLAHVEEPFLNPCSINETIPADIPTFIHQPPAIAYRNKDDNLLPDAFFPRLDGEGNLLGYSINDPEAGVAGVPFIGISSMAGDFYQGSSFPEMYKGKYFHPDYQGWIRVFELDENNVIQKIEPFHSAALNIISLAENPKDGCLYYIDFKNKRLRKICYGGNPAPVVVLQTDKYFGPSPLTVQLDASSSFSPGSSPLTYEWNFGNGVLSSAMSPSYTFTAPSNEPYAINVELSVTDTFGQTRIKNTIISLNNTPPEVDITSLADSSFYSLNRTTLLHLEGDAVDDEHAENNLIFEWRTFLHHDEHEHTDLIEEEKSSQFFISPLGCQDEIYWYKIVLNVTDGAGLTGRDTAWIFPYCEDDLFKLKYFNANKNNKNVVLEWESEIEKEILYYELERGATIFDFKSLHKINATGPAEYIYTDHYPLTGSNFYRLKIWNSENIFSYTAPVMVDYETVGEDILLYPNPATDRVSLSIKNTNSEIIEFKLYSIYGSLIHRTILPTTVNTYFNEPLYIPDISGGIYFYEIKNGTEIKKGGIVFK